jgi:hypothetical protein
VTIIKSVLNERKKELISVKWMIMKKESKRNMLYGKIKIRDHKEKTKIEKGLDESHQENELLRNRNWELSEGE